MAITEKPRSIVELVQERAPQLTPSERRLARALLATYPISGLESVAQLAARGGVSAPTALRLVLKLGFSGYPSFQRAVREEVQARISAPASRYQPLPPTGPGAEAVAHWFEELARVIADTASLQSSLEFDQVSDLLADPSRRVMALGSRVSHVLSAHLIGQLSQLRPRTQLLPAGSPRLMEELVDISRRDVAVIFDYRRYQRDTIDFARGAARRRATVVVVTDPLLSPAAQAARHVLTFRLGTMSPLETPIGGFALVEALLAEAARRLRDSACSRLRALEDLNRYWMWDRTLIEAEPGEARPDQIP